MYLSLCWIEFVCLVALLCILLGFLAVQSIFASIFFVTLSLFICFSCIIMVNVSYQVVVSLAMYFMTYNGFVCLSVFIIYLEVHFTRLSPRHEPRLIGIGLDSSETLEFSD